MTKLYMSFRFAILQVLGVFGDFTQVWSANVPVSKGVSDLTDVVNAIDKQSAIQSVKTQGFTKNK